MSVHSAHARPGNLGRLILRRVFDAAHTRPRPHLCLPGRPPGADTTHRDG